MNGGSFPEMGTLAGAAGLGHVSEVCGDDIEGRGDGQACMGREREN